MRKWIWSATALTVFGAMAMYLAAQHAAEHPDSLTARCFRAAGCVGMRCNPLLVMALPEPPLRRLDKPINQPICLMPEPMEMTEHPPEMCLPAIGDSPEVCEPIVVESEPPVTGSFDEEDFDPPTAASTGDDDENPGYPAYPPTQYTEEESVPMMPYVEDDDACDESVDEADMAGECLLGCDHESGCCEKAQSHAPCGILRLMECVTGENSCLECGPRSLGEAIADYLRCLAGDDETCDDFEAIPEDPVESPDEPVDEEIVDEDMLEDAESADEATEDASEMPPTDEQPMTPREEGQDNQPRQPPAHEYHHHYPSCPYTGHCPYPYHYNVPRVDPPAARPAAEEQEPLAEPARPMKPVKKKKVLWFMGEMLNICQPGVDTMECRPTDIYGEVESPF